MKQASDQDDTLKQPEARHAPSLSVSIIIPAWNEAEQIAEAVDQAWATGPLEVIVVDGGSTDRTAEIAAERGAQVLTSRRGRAVQMNLGASVAGGDVLLFLHADNWLTPGGVQQIVEALDRDSGLQGGAFYQRIEADGFLYRLLEKGNAWRARRRGLPYGDQGIFLRREMFDRLGGYPEVALMEDLLLMKQFRRHTCPVLLPGPLHISARRWQRQGVIRQTLRNWRLLTLHALGVPPDRLARSYRPHKEVD